MKENAAATNTVPDLENLINTYGDSLLRMCVLYLKDYHTAEDAVQETFIKAYYNRLSFHGDSSVKTWITRIAINVCKSYLRSAKTEHEVTVSELPVEPACEDNLYDDSLINEVLKLDRKYREVILLYYYQELKQREIADILGTSEANVAKLLGRGRQQLRKKLKGWYFDEQN